MFTNKYIYREGKGKFKKNEKLYIYYQNKNKTSKLKLIFTVNAMHFQED